MLQIGNLIRAKRRMRLIRISGHLSKGVYEADKAEPHQTTGAEREDGLDTERRGWKTHPRGDNAPFSDDLRGERSGENERTGTVRKMDRLTALRPIS
jgi:hypothetical protein